MPIIRYFAFVGCLLVALLVAADRYWASPVDRASAPELDKTTIRIRSARHLPEKIVFDTSKPAIVVSAQPAVVDDRTQRTAEPRMTTQSKEKNQKPPEPKAMQERVQIRRAAKVHRRSGERRRLAVNRVGSFEEW